MFRCSVKGTGYPLHSPVSSSLPLPCIAGCHHISTGEVKCTLVQALRLCTGRTAHRGSRGIALLFLDHGNRRCDGLASRPGRSLPSETSSLRTGDWVGPRVGLDRCGKSRPPPGFDRGTVQPVASRCTNLATGPTHFNWALQQIFQRRRYLSLCHEVFQFGSVSIFKERGGNGSLRSDPNLTFIHLKLFKPVLRRSMCKVEFTILRIYVILWGEGGGFL